MAFSSKVVANFNAIFKWPLNLCISSKTHLNPNPQYIYIYLNCSLPWLLFQFFIFKLLINHCHCGVLLCAFYSWWNVEKPNSGDVSGGTNQYDYRPSTTFDNRRRKYTKKTFLFFVFFLIFCFCFLLYQLNMTLFITSAWKRLQKKQQKIFLYDKS